MRNIGYRIGKLAVTTIYVQNGFCRDSHYIQRMDGNRILRKYETGSRQREENVEDHHEHGKAKPMRPWLEDGSYGTRDMV